MIQADQIVSRDRCLHLHEITRLHSAAENRAIFRDARSNELIGKRLSYSRLNRAQPASCIIQYESVSEAKPIDRSISQQCRPAIQPFLNFMHCMRAVAPRP